MIRLMAPSSRIFLSLMGRSSATSLRMMSTSPVTYPKAAFMVIGDEVLKGSTVDTNTPWLASKLYSRGVDVRLPEFPRHSFEATSLHPTPPQPTEHAQDEDEPADTTASHE